VRSFFEGDFDADAQIAAALRTVAATLTAATAEEGLKNAATASTTAAAEHLIEDVVGIVEAAAPTAAAGAAHAALREGGVAVAIVSGTLVGVAEHIVGLTDLLEFVLRGLVTGVFVRVVFHRELAVGFLQILRAHIT